MFHLLRERNFGLYWFGQLISLLGDCVLYVALPFYVYELTGSALATGGMFVAQVLPSILLAPLAGVLVDRWDRRRTMIVADLGRAAVLPLLLLVRSPERVWLIYVVGFVEAAISRFFSPAKNSLLPRLVGEKELLAANSMNATSDNFARLVGPSAGGALMALLGLTSVVVIDVVSYLLSALMLSLIVLPRDASPQPARAAPLTIAGRLYGVWREWLEGMGLLREQPLLANLFVVMALAVCADGMITALLVVFVNDVLNGRALEFGWIITARGAGGLLGGVILGQLSEIFQPTRLIILGVASAGALFLALVNFPSLLVTLVLIFLLGVPATAWLVSIQTLLQQRVPEDYRGRIFGTYEMTLSLTLLGGMGLGSGLGEVVGVAPTLNLAGALFVVAGTVALLTLRDTV